MDKATELLPMTIEGALDATPICMIEKVINQVKIEAFIAYHLTRLAADSNIDSRLNIQQHQVATIAQALMEEFSYESLADINLCLKRGAKGFYGEIFKIDKSVVIKWMQSYLDEKYDALEQRKNKEKYPEKPLPPTKEIVDGRKYIKEMLENLGVPQKEHGPREETEFQKHKLEAGYKVSTPEEVEARKQKIRVFQERAIRDKYPAASEEEIKQMIENL